ncbi:pyridoxamine 5'-phosphate oxidase family protein, partial [Actinomadura adrarensis]
MTGGDPIETTNLDIYGDAALPWSRALDGLEAALSLMETAQFLGTVSPDGRPHSAGVGGLWQDGTIYFTSGPGTRKARHLTVNPACTFSVRLPGIDLVLEGEARQITDRETL